jgi:Flp pilus assembly protein TadG
VRSQREAGSEASGQILVLFALMLVVLLAALAVILDGGRVFAERRATQNAADAAAMAGASKLVKSDPVGSLPAVLTAACEAANKNGGFGSGTNDGTTCGTTGADVRVHVPGADGGTTPLTNVNPVFENPGYVQVSVHMSFKSFMSGLLGLADFESSSIGVAVNIAGNGLGDALLVLDPIDCGALTLNGTNTLTVAGGNVQVNSSAAKSADTFCTNKNAAIRSGASGGLTNTSGANNIVGSGDATNVVPPWTQSSYKPDPLTRVTVPPFDSTFVSPAGSGTPNVPAPWNPPTGAVSANPGVYWGGITVQNNTTLTLAPGTYIMAGGGFNMSGATATVTATGAVTFIYTRDPYCNSTLTSPPTGCNNTAKKNGDIDGGASSVGESGGFWGTTASQLQPQVLSPDPYNLTNVLIYVDRNVRSTSGDPCPAVTLDVGGGGYFNFATGSIIYGPCTFVRLHGTSTPLSHGGAVVSWTVLIDGTKDLDLGGPAVGGEPFAQSNLVQ